MAPRSMLITFTLRLISFCLIRSDLRLDFFEPCAIHGWPLGGGDKALVRFAKLGVI